MEHFPTFTLVAGNLALDLVNTVANRASSQARECLVTVTDLKAWSDAAGLTLNGVLTLADLGEVRTLREHLHEAFAAAIAGQPLPDGDLAAIDSRLDSAKNHWRLRSQGARAAYAWRDQASGADHILLPILGGATTLLTGDDLARVKVCAGHGCGWLFLDQSRNGLRRWCSMGDCGNRAKAARFYRRLKA